MEYGLGWWCIGCMVDSQGGGFDCSGSGLKSLPRHMK